MSARRLFDFRAKSLWAIVEAAEFRLARTEKCDGLPDFNPGDGEYLKSLANHLSKIAYEQTLPYTKDAELDPLWMPRNHPACRAFDGSTEALQALQRALEFRIFWFQKHREEKSRHYGCETIAFGEDDSGLLDSIIQYVETELARRSGQAPDSDVPGGRAENPRPQH